MERISVPKKAWVFVVAFLIFSFLAGGSLTAGTVLVPLQPTSRSADADDIFPESRFGYTPERQTTGIETGYASRAVHEMEDEDYQTGASRRPAGLVFGEEARADEPAAPRVPRKVEEDAAPPKAKKMASVRSEPVTSAPTITSRVGRKGVQEVALIAGDLGYFPKTVFVSRDVPVRLYVTGASKNTLCIMMDSFQVRKQVRSQKIEEITFTPNTPGKFRFYCPVNGMEGTLVVKEFATTSVVEPSGD